MDKFRQIHERFAISRKDCCIICGDSDTENSKHQNLCTGINHYPCCYNAMQCMVCGVYWETPCKCKVLCNTQFCAKHKKYIPAYRFAISGDIVVRVPDTMVVRDITNTYWLEPGDALGDSRTFLGINVPILLHIGEDSSLSVRCYKRGMPSALIPLDKLIVEHYGRKTTILYDMLLTREARFEINNESLDLLPEHVLSVLIPLLHLQQPLSLLQACINTLKRRKTPRNIIQKLPIELRERYNN